MWPRRVRTLLLRPSGRVLTLGGHQQKSNLLASSDPLGRKPAAAAGGLGMNIIAGGNGDNNTGTLGGMSAGALSVAHVYVCVGLCRARVAPAPRPCHTQAERCPEVFGAHNGLPT